MEKNVSVKGYVINCMIREKSYCINENVKITIKGIGKFKIGEIFGTSKSGRLKIKIYKYT